MMIDTSLKKKPHLAHIIGTLGAGGVQRYILNLLSSPDLAGFEQSVICVYGADGQLARDFQTLKAQVFDCPFPYPNTLPIPSYRLSRWIRHSLIATFPYRLSFLLKNMQADLVHTHVTAKIDLQARAVLAYARVPWVWSIHGSYKPRDLELERWKRALTKMSTSKAYLTFVSGRIAEEFRASGLTGIHNSSKVVYVGVDSSFFSNNSVDEYELRRTLNIPCDCVLFGSLGRLVSEKAFDNLIEAASIVNQDKVWAHVVIAGEGILREQLTQKILELGVGEFVHLLGYTESAFVFLRNLDAFILPSRSEGFPIALLEAMATGLPCIATDVGGIKEMVGDEGAIIVLPESPCELALAMRQFSSAEIRKRYAARSVGLAQQYTVEKSILDFRNIYEELLRKSTASKVGY